MTGVRTLLLLGGGGHAAVVAESARAAGWNVAGYLDDRPEDGAAAQVRLKRLGAIRDLQAALAALPAGAFGHAAVGDPALRRRWLEEFGGAAAPAVVDCSAAVSPSAVAAPGAFIGPRAVVNARAVIGRGAIVNSGAIVEHDCRLGEFCHIGPGAVLGGGAAVGAGALVGMNASVLPGIRIGARAVLGAGAVAAADVPPEVTAVGVPARTGSGSLFSAVRPGARRRM